MPSYVEKKYKSILIVRKFVDSWFWERYAINPYNGCEHGCIYCDSRSSKYHLPDDFENEIIVKTRVAKMLRERLSKARTLLPDVVGMSGASDPYHPAEIKYQNTRQCLEILNEFKFPVHILTKSILVLRDKDLLSQIAKNNWASVSLTITTADNDISRFLEPNASTPTERFKVIETIKKEYPQVQCGILLMPLLPFITDSNEQLEKLIGKASESGADYVLFSSGVTMRDRQATWFLNKIHDRYPHLIKKYERMFCFKYNPSSYKGNYNVPSGYYNKRNEILKELCFKYNIPYRIKRFIPNDFRKINYLVAERIFEISYNKHISGKVYSGLHWAGNQIQQLKVPVSELYYKNKLATLKIRDESVFNTVMSEVEKALPNSNHQVQLDLF